MKARRSADSIVDRKWLESFRRSPIDNSGMEMGGDHMQDGSEVTKRPIFADGIVVHPATRRSVFWSDVL